MQFYNVILKYTKKNGFSASILCSLAVSAGAVWFMENLPAFIHEATSNHRNPVDYETRLLMMFAGLAMMGLAYFVLQKLKSKHLTDGAFLHRQAFFELSTKHPRNNQASREQLTDLMHDIQRFWRQSSTVLYDVPCLLLLAVTLAGILIWTGHEVGLLVAVIAVATAVVNQTILAQSDARLSVQQQAQTDLRQACEFIFSNIKDIKTWTATNRYMERFYEKNGDLWHVQTGLHHQNANRHVLVALSDIIAVAALLWYATATAMNVIDLIALSLATWVLMKVVTHLPPIRTSVRFLNAFADNYHRLLQQSTPPGTIGTADAFPKQDHLTIEIDDVNCTHTSADEILLENINLEIRQGDWLCISGSKGAGKSTLLDLLMGLSTPTQGEIKINGVDMGNIPQSTWLNQLGFMQTRVPIVEASLAENIAVANHHATRQQILTAVKSVGLLPLLERLDLDLESAIHENDPRLWESEKTRIGLARLTVREASLIILDDPVGHLNTGIRQSVADIIQTLFRDKTLVMVSNHKEFIQLADRHLILRQQRLWDARQPKQAKSRVKAAALTKRQAVNDGKSTKQQSDQNQLAEMQSSTDTVIPVLNTQNDTAPATIHTQSQPKTTKNPVELYEQASATLQSTRSSEQAWQAAQLLQQAADMGYAPAQSDLGTLYETGFGVDRDLTKAAELYRASADQGLAQAQSNLGVLYENGWGVAQDAAQALKWYEVAAEQNHSKAQNNLAVLYLKGSGVARDDKKAAFWFEKAAEQGNLSAMFNLAMLYEDSPMLAKDLDKARFWYQKAADRGHSKARQRLNVLSYLNVLN